VRRAQYTLSLTSHHTEVREALEVRRRRIRGFPLLLGDIELLDEAVELFQRLVEGHELA
jgi:hypothetical protein